ncbi:MAG TPA: penicillin-binding transpeptidase domain-containing protein [Vicinamibacterales bacterium]|nr:penicillin-binding transpeptidase domain-containing protein [Vicinamibacterales bacterium]
MKHPRKFLCAFSVGCFLWGGWTQPRPAVPPSGSCFLLLDTANGNMVREPNDVCETRLPPASTFKIPHAIAALDAGVIKDQNEVIPYDGSPRDYEAWRRDHTLASAMRYSVVWYFQELATRLGMSREEFYLRRLRYGNADPSSGLTTFWLGGSLRISPIEQMTFLRRLYYEELPVPERVMRIVKEILIQPHGTIVNATGEHPFDAPWPADTQVSAKTGSTSFGDHRAVRWIVGHVKRGDHAWLFVSCVTGADTIDGNAAIELAAKSLRANHVLD